MMFSAPWITATGQRWKLLVVYVLLAALIVMTVGALVPSVSQLVTQERELFRFLCGLTGVVGIGWIAFAVRCPSCTRRTGWWYLQNTGVTECFTAFVSARQCPVCGYEGDTRRHEP